MDEAAARDSVWETVRALNHAWAVDADTSRLHQDFHADMVAIGASGRHRIEGREACVAAWQGFLDRGKVTRWEERDPDVRLHGQGKLAVVTYYYDMTVAIAGRAIDLSGRDMLVLVEEGGRWRVVADHFSSFPEVSG